MIIGSVAFGGKGRVGLHVDGRRQWTIIVGRGFGIDVGGGHLMQVLDVDQNARKHGHNAKTEDDKLNIETIARRDFHHMATVNVNAMLVVDGAQREEACLVD